MTKFDKGDQVRLVYGYEDMHFEDDPYMLEEMKHLGDEVFTIKRIWSTEPNWYKVEENDFVWDERWFEPANTKVPVIHEDDFMNIFVGD